MRFGENSTLPMLLPARLESYIIPRKLIFIGQIQKHHLIISDSPTDEADRPITTPGRCDDCPALLSGPYSRYIALIEYPNGCYV